MRRKKYEKRRKESLDGHREELLELLRKEWGEVERTHQKKELREKLYRYTKETGVVLAKTILVLAAVGGALTIAAVAPNIFAVAGRMSGQRRFFHDKEFKKAAARLREQKLIRVNNDKSIELTQKGLFRVANIAFGDLKIKKPPKWDGLWRVVIFDIPDKHKWSRDSFRRKLRELGFLHLQKSVFVTPYPCLAEIKLLSSFFNIADYTHFLQTSIVSNDGVLRKHFKL
jgi:hypothetical protein